MDSHTLVKRLQAGGLSEEAAEALADAVLQRPGDLATKQDLESLATQKDLNALREEMREEFASVRTEMANLRTDMAGAKTDMASMEARLAHTIRNAILTSVLVLTAVVGALVTVMKVVG